MDCSLIFREDPHPYQGGSYPDPQRYKACCNAGGRCSLVSFNFFPKALRLFTSCWVNSGCCQSSAAPTVTARRMSLDRSEIMRGTSVLQSISPGGTEEGCYDRDTHVFRDTIIFTSSLA